MKASRYAGVPRRRRGGDGNRIGRTRAIALTLLAVGCVSPDAPAPALTVELDVFSGRPNPTWALTDAEAAETLDRLRGLPRVSDALPDLGLGYRGFLVSGAAGADFPGRAYVSSGLIALGAPDRAAVYRDVNDLESFLVALARARGYGGALPR